jgi:hypothetical protein
MPPAAIEANCSVSRVHFSTALANRGARFRRPGVTGKDSDTGEIDGDHEGRDLGDERHVFDFFEH